MCRLAEKLGSDDRGFLHAFIVHARALAEVEDDQARYAALSGLSSRATRLLKAYDGEIPHAPNDSPATLWADFSGAITR